MDAKMDHVNAMLEGALLYQLNRHVVQKPVVPLC